MSCSSIDEAVDFLASNAKYISDAAFRRLRNLQPMRPLPSLPGESAGKFDLLAEVQEQMAVVQALRRKLTDVDALDVSPRDLKDLITTSTSLFSMLTKQHNDIMNQDRVRKIEAATVSVILTLPQEMQDKFFGELHKSLEKGMP